MCLFDPLGRSHHIPDTFSSSFNKSHRSGSIRRLLPAPVGLKNTNGSTPALVRRYLKFVERRVTINPLIAIADKRSIRFADIIADNSLQLIEYDTKILWGEQHDLAETAFSTPCLSLPEPVLQAPSLNRGLARGSAHWSSEYQRGVLGDRFCRSARHTHDPASQGQQQTPEE